MLAAFAFLVIGSDMPQSDIAVTIQEPSPAVMENMFRARCGGVRLKLSGFGSQAEVVLTVNGKHVAISSTPLPAALREPGALYRFSAVCEKTAKAMEVKYYSANGLGGKPVYKVGRFVVSSAGALRYGGDEVAEAESFWFK